MKEGTIEAQVDAGVTSAFDKIKSLFTPKAADLEKAIKDLDGANKTIGELKGQITDLEGKLKAAQMDVKTATEAKDAAEKKAKETEESVTLRANQQALAIEQGRGVTAPVKAEEKPAGAGGKSKSQEYCELQEKDPKAAGEFFAEHMDAILGGR